MHSFSRCLPVLKLSGKFFAFVILQEKILCPLGSNFCDHAFIQLQFCFCDLAGKNFMPSGLKLFI